MQVESFGRVRQARRPATYIALGIAMTAVYLSITMETSRLVPVLAVMYLALVLFRLLRNPGKGFRISSERIDWYTSKGRRSAQINDLQSVSIGNDLNGQTVCVLKLNDGRAVPLSGVERIDQRELMRAFGHHGIRIIA